MHETSFRYRGNQILYQKFGILPGITIIHQWTTFDFTHHYEFLYLFSLRAALNKTYYHEPIVAKTKSIELNSSEILDTLPTDRKNELKVNIERQLLLNFTRILFPLIISYFDFKN